MGTRRSRERDDDDSARDLEARPTAPLVPSAPFPPDSAEHPARIAEYRILDVLGEGGMGTVYLAEQEHPVRRRVALKVVKPGMDTRAVVARFESERQALAVLSHPCIARVFDAGVTREGRPFFVMEHVPGIPITDYCDQQGLAMRERLLLMAQVCDAVQHAHQRGIIHRDLKPTNVLVSSPDGKPVPKIIDFGLAKAVHQRLTERTIFTEMGQLIGTPEYMSPEQIEMGPLEIDTRTDIYALGVLLYELLAGALPFESQSLRKAGYVELQRRIREDEPPKPSTRVSRLGAASTAVARRRRTTVVSLAKQLRGDLDWITMRAMEKDRTRRYASASELGAEIHRYLADEPVLAGPPTATYRLRKFVRKHRGPLSGIAAVMVTLAVATVTSTSLFVQARHNARLAGSKEEIAKLKTLEARTALAEYERLADVKRLQDLRAEAERQLWPAHPEKIDAMNRWIQRAEIVAKNLPDHRVALAALRETALPYTDEMKERDLEAHADDVEKLAALRASRREIESALATPGRTEGYADILRSQLTSIVAELRRVEATASRRETWRFNSAEAQWKHDVLAGLARDLEALSDPDRRVGLVADIRARLAAAEALRRREADDADAWRHAIASIADIRECPKYGGLRLAPQVGLVPIGRDPDSGLWEFADVQSGEVPARGPDGRLHVGEKTGIVLVLLPGGTFEMGADPPTGDRKAGPNVDPFVDGDESPVSAVTLTPFLLSKFEMTQGQWLHFTGENPSGYAPEVSLATQLRSLSHPVEQVSYSDCHRVLSRMGLQIPSEAQWEYAARGGTTTIWCTGDDRDSLRGSVNLADRAAKRAGQKWPAIADWPDLDDKFVEHAPVGSFSPNAFGLCDVHGNVSEWCADGYGDYSQPVREGDGLRRVTHAKLRVYRGGSFYDEASHSRSSTRNTSPPDFRDYILGVRPARSL